MIYNYISEDGQEIEREYPMGQSEQQVVVDGITYNIFIKKAPSLHGHPDLSNN